MNGDAAIFQEVDQRWPRFLLQRVADGFVKCTTGWTGFFLLCQPVVESVHQWSGIPPSPLVDFFPRAMADFIFQPEQLAYHLQRHPCSGVMVGFIEVGETPADVAPAPGVNDAGVLFRHRFISSIVFRHQMTGPAGQK